LTSALSSRNQPNTTSTTNCSRKSQHDVYFSSLLMMKI